MPVMAERRRLNPDFRPCVGEHVGGSGPVYFLHKLIIGAQMRMGSTTTNKGNELLKTRPHKSRFNNLLQIGK